MFRTLIYPSSGACDYCWITTSVVLFSVVCWRFGAAGFEWCSCCRLNSCASACNTSITQNQPHQISNTQRIENKTTDVVIQQHSRKLLMMDILMSEICWAYKKWNKIASDIKLVFHSSRVNRYFKILYFAFHFRQTNKQIYQLSYKRNILKKLTKTEILLVLSLRSSDCSNCNVRNECMYPVLSGWCLCLGGFPSSLDQKPVWAAILPFANRPREYLGPTDSYFMDTVTYFVGPRFYTHLCKIKIPKDSRIFSRPNVSSAWL